MGIGDELKEGSTEEFENITGQHHEPDDEDHFCVVEDYPCGPNNDKVHVCHYSSRDGTKHSVYRKPILMPRDSIPRIIAVPVLVSETLTLRKKKEQRTKNEISYQSLY